MGVPLEEHVGKVDNQVIGRNQVKRGGIYRRYHEGDDHGEYGNWFVVTSEPYWDNHAYRIDVYDLEEGGKDQHFLGDLGVMPYGTDNYNESNALQRHPDGLRIPTRLMAGRSWVTRIVRWIFG